jgi:hypothetical protein
MKYLLLRTQGGLADQLSQMEKGYLLAQQYQRTLIVDTTKGPWKDYFSYYFSPIVEHTDSIILQANFSQLETLSISPAIIEKIGLQQYKHGYIIDDAQKVRVVEKTTSTELSGYGPPDVRASVILHHGKDGGGLGNYFLRRLQMTIELCEIVLDKLSSLPPIYNAVHVRNTDITSDYGSLVSNPTIQDSSIPLFIASDDANVFSWFASAFPRHSLVRLSTHQHSSSLGLHKASGAQPPRSRNIEAICDLLALAQSKHLVIAAPVERKVPGGFSRLAIDLHGDSRLRAQLLRSDPPSDEFAVPSRIV